MTVLVAATHGYTYYQLHFMKNLSKPLSLRAYEAYNQAYHLSETSDPELIQSLQSVYETAWGADTATIEARFDRFAAYFVTMETLSKKQDKPRYDFLLSSYETYKNMTHAKWLEVGCYLEQHQALLDEMQALTTLNGPVCPLNTEIGGEHPSIYWHLFYIEKIPKWLRVAAIVQAHQGNTEKAYEYILSSFHTLDLLIPEPYPSSSASRFYVIEAAIDSTVQIFEPGTLSTEQTEQLVQLAKTHLARPRGTEAYSNYIYYFKPLFLEPEECKDSFFTGRFSLAKHGYLVEAHIYSNPAATPIRSLNYSKFASYMLRLKELSRQPHYLADEEYKAIKKEINSLSSVFFVAKVMADLEMTYPGVQGMIESYLSLYWMGLTLEQYYVEHGEYPAHLEDVIPDAPLDPYSGEPYRYIVTDNDFYLYSVGQDKVDNGGLDLLDRVWRGKSRPEAVLEYEKQQLEDNRGTPSRRRRLRTGFGERRRQVRELIDTDSETKPPEPTPLPPNAIPMLHHIQFESPMLTPDASGNSYILPGMPLDGPCIGVTWASGYDNCTMGFYDADFELVAAWREPVGFGEMVMNATAGDLDGDGAAEIVLTIRRDNPGIHVLNWNAEKRELEPRWAYTWQGSESEPFLRGTAVGNFTAHEGLEICFGNDHGTYFLLDKDGTLITTSTDAPRQTVQRIDTCDTDGDGYHDMIVATGRAPGEVHRMRWQPESAALEVIWSTDVTPEGKGGNNCYEAVFHPNGHPDGGPAIAASTEQEEGDHQGSVVLLDMDGKILWQRFHDQSGEAEKGRYVPKSRRSRSGSGGALFGGIRNDGILPSSTEGRAGGCGFGDLTGDGIPEIFTRYTYTTKRKKGSRGRETEPIPEEYIIQHHTGLLIYDNHGTRLDKLRGIATSSAGPHAFQPNGPNSDPTYLVTTNEVYEVLRRDKETP